MKGAISSFILHPLSLPYKALRNLLEAMALIVIDVGWHGDHDLEIEVAKFVFGAEFGHALVAQANHFAR